MSFIHVVGYVATDPELKVSQAGNPYMRFDLVERLGNGRIQSYQIWAYGWEAQRLSRWGLRQGAVLDVNGPLAVEEYTAEDGFTPKVRLKIIYRDGSRYPVSKPTSPKKKNPTTPAATPPSDRELPAGRDRIDGDREPLPD